MNKRQRHQLIQSILRERPVDSQQELAEALAAEGCEVTQATVSRDLKEMGLLKGRDSGGHVRYVTGPVGFERADTSSACGRMLSEFGRGIKQAQNLLVMRCDPGAAPGLGRVVDELEHEAILGCVAGDDTVIVGCDDNRAAAAVHEYLTELGG